jgi:hypothetical protein
MVGNGMRTRRSLNLVLAVAAALLAAGTTFAWAGVLVGGHRADHIGTFEPIARRLVPASVPGAPSGAPTAPPTAASSSAAGASTGTRAPESFLTPATGRTTTSPGEVTAATASGPTTTRHSDDPKTPTTPTTDDNGRSNDD